MDLKKAEQFIFDKMNRSTMPGLALALVTPDAEETYRSFGFRNVERGLPVTPDTLFAIASITKSFTCIAIMQLQERGLLSVDDPVEKYVPLKIRPGGQPIRLRHFMSHTSGIPALGFAEAVLRREAGGGRRNPAYFEPGQHTRLHGGCGGLGACRSR